MSAVRSRKRNPSSARSKGRAKKVPSVEKHVDQAIRHLGEAVAIRPADAEYRYRFGVALHLAGQLNEAMEQYQAAIRLHPRHLEAHDNLGRLYCEIRRMEEAEVQLREALKRQPDNPHGLCSLAIVLREQGRLDEAETLLQGLLRKVPDNAMILNWPGYSSARVAWMMPCPCISAR